MRKLFYAGIAGAFVLGLIAQPQQRTISKFYPQYITQKVPPANQPADLAQAILIVQDEASTAQSGVATLRKLDKR